MRPKSAWAIDPETKNENKKHRMKRAGENKERRETRGRGGR